MRAVFDLDDTICVHKNRDYPNAKPITAVIEKMHKMKNDGWEIVVYTARGQVSCKGNIELIEKKNRTVVEEWLKKNDVPCDELIFGKPLGDLYIDDKGMSLEDFLEQPFERLSGGSGKSVYRQGNIVKKDLGTSEEAAEFKAWIAANKGEYKIPKIYSYLYDTVYMEYIDGKRGCDVDAVFVPNLINRILKCKETSPQNFDIKPHIERLLKNKTGDEHANYLLEKIACYLSDSALTLNLEGSFCHGDLTLSNIIVKGEELYFIDARNTTGANSYLLDLAKLRMSLNGYERIFGISCVDNSKWSKYIDTAASKLGLLEEVLALEVMFIFRCYRYKNGDDKKKLIQFALEEGSSWA